MKYVHYNINIIKQDPVALPCAFGHDRFVSLQPHAIFDSFSDCADMHPGATGDNDKVIANGGNRFQFQNLDIEPFFVQGESSGEAGAGQCGLRSQVFLVVSLPMPWESDKLR